MEDEDPVEKNIETIAKAGMDTLETILPENPRWKSFVDQLETARPGIAVGLNAAAKICSGVAETSNFFPLKILGICLAGAARVIDPKNADPDYKTGKILSVMKQRMDILEKKTDFVLDKLHEIQHKSGMKVIHTQHKQMLQVSCIEVWTKEFHGNVANFRSYLSDFDKKSLQELFRHIYRKCDKDLAQLEEIFDYVISTRTLYLQILIMYYTNFGSMKIQEKESAIANEIELYYKALTDISNWIDEECIFFNAIKTLDKSCPFHAVYIPDIPEDGKSSRKFGTTNAKGETEKKKGEITPLSQEHPFQKFIFTDNSSVVAVFTPPSMLHATYWIKEGPALRKHSGSTYLGFINAAGLWKGATLQREDDDDCIIYREWNGKGQSKGKAMYFQDFQWGKQRRQSILFAPEYQMQGELPAGEPSRHSIQSPAQIIQPKETHEPKNQVKIVKVPSGRNITTSHGRSSSSSSSGSDDNNKIAQPRQRNIPIKLTDDGTLTIDTGKQVLDIQNLLKGANISGGSISTVISSNIERSTTNPTAASRAFSVVESNTARTEASESLGGSSDAQTNAGEKKISFTTGNKNFNIKIQGSGASNTDAEILETVRDGKKVRTINIVRK